jgi:putative membrane protein
MLAKEFARELGHDVNEHLNERRWQLVLLGAAGSQRSVDSLRLSVDQLHNGAHELTKGLNELANATRQSATGAQRLYTGVDQLTDGVKQLGAGLRTMEARHPRNAELDHLKNGAEQLAAGHAELGRGMKELQSGSQRIRTGVAAFREEAHGSLLLPSRVSDGMDALFDGVVQLDAGLQTAGDAQVQLDDGASKLSAGVGTLTTGIRAMNSGLHTMLSKMPEESQLDELDNGASALSNGLAALNAGSHKANLGAERLAAGLHLLASSLPATVDQPEGSAQGLANSVKPVLEIVAAVPNSGSAFAPNVLPAALWLGAGIAAFLIHVRVLPKHAMQFSKPAQLTGKLLIPLLVVLAQAGLLYVTVTVVMHIQVVEPGWFGAALALSSAAFLGIVFALTRAFGDAGKALSMIFLAIQLSSSGGIMPVELSGGLFSEISPWLPLTWVVRAMKATMFGAYAGDWGQPMLVITLTGVLSLCSACWLGRWRFVQPAQVRPTVDF